MITTPTETERSFNPYVGKDGFCILDGYFILGRI